MIILDISFPRVKLRENVSGVLNRLSKSNDLYDVTKCAIFHAKLTKISINWSISQEEHTLNLGPVNSCLKLEFDHFLGPFRTHIQGPEREIE